MAMYHFRIKSDKKPNGTKISAVKHAEYIDCEGSFAHDEQWKENNKFGGDCVFDYYFACQPHTPNALWFIQNREELTCFCKLMNLMVWTNSQENVISACDGIFQASEKD